MKHFERPKEPGTYFRLLALNGRNKGIAYVLHGDRVVLGRAESCDIRLFDSKSSREHAEVVKVGLNYMVTDLGSQNGTLVNMEKVSQAGLADGDKLIVGKSAFKFDSVFVESKRREDPEVDFVDQNFDEEPEDKKKKMNLALLGVIGVGLVILLGGNEGSVEVKKKKRLEGSSSVNVVNETLVAGLNVKEKNKKENQEKLQLYIQRGLREFREKNYFRAINEFEHAVSWSPNDALAQFYLRKTKESLDRNIQQLFITGKRDEDALKFYKASSSYCSVVRILRDYPEDERYKNAAESIKRLEGQLGLDEGEIECLDAREREPHEN